MTSACVRFFIPGFPSTIRPSTMGPSMRASLSVRPWAFSGGKSPPKTTMKEVQPAPLAGVPKEHWGVSPLPYTLGPFSKADLDTTFGTGNWWPMRRFAIFANALKSCSSC